MVHTSKQSLKNLWDQKITTIVQQRWLYKLMRFDFVIKYKRGKENILVGILSRGEENREIQGEVVALSQLIMNWIKAIKDETQTNPTLQWLVQLVKDGEAVAP